ncbi:MAG: transposase, partial [Bacteroidota bacterium]
SQPLAEQLHNFGIELIYKPKKNMKKPKVIPLYDRLKLAQRGVIECTIDQLKNQAYVEHSRHRSFGGFLINVLSAICSYAFDDKHPKPRFQFPFLVEIDPKYLLAA